MNQHGTIVGSYTDENDRVHGFFRDPNGRFTTFDVPGSIRTVIRDINPAGTIAGIYRDANNVRHGYLRTADGAVTSFDIPGGSFGSAECFDTCLNPAGVLTGIYLDPKGVISSHAIDDPPGNNQCVGLP